MASSTLPILLCLVILVNCRTLLYEGDPCTVPATQGDGKCINIEKCEYARQLLQTKADPEFCGFTGRTPLVCCPPPKARTVGNISASMCKKYYDASLTFTISVDLGQKALPKEFPHMSAIGFGKDNSSISWLCGGTLISRNFVLTAAHCVNSREFGPAKWVRLGDLDLKDTTEEASPLDLVILESYVHPNYNSRSHYHDIALLKLDRSADFSFFYKAACLHTDKAITEPNLEAIGWGKQGLFGETSSHLLKVSLNSVDYRTCAEQYANVDKRKLKNGIMDEFQLCAGSKIGGDTCPGDSGGPLHYQMKPTEELKRHYVVVGITSFGKGCGGENSIGVYTRVSSYLDWIEKIVWPEQAKS